MSETPRHVLTEKERAPFRVTCAKVQSLRYGEVGCGNPSTTVVDPYPTCTRCRDASVQFGDDTFEVPLPLLRRVTGVRQGSPVPGFTLLSQVSGPEPTPGPVSFPYKNPGSWT